MARFVFRLQRALEYRKFLQDSAARELARAEEVLVVERARLARFREDLGALLGEQRNVQASGRIEAWRLSSVAAVVAAIREQISLQGRIIAEAEIEVGNRRAALVEARKQLRSLEILRDKDQAKWRKEQDRLETIQLDEMFAGSGRPALS